LSASAEGLGAAAGKADDQPGASAGSHSAGCDTDLPHYEAILSAPGAHSAAELDAARYAAAVCYQRLGRVDAARRAFTALLDVPAYAEASRRALSILPESSGRSAESNAHAVAAKKAAPAKPAPAAATQTKQQAPR
jgi:hypothetical protein